MFPDMDYADKIFLPYLESFRKFDIALFAFAEVFFVNSFIKI